MSHVTVADNSPRVSYTAAAYGQTDFPISFAFFDPSTDLDVKVDGENATYSAAPLTSLQYSVTATAVDGGYDSGTVVLGAAVASVSVIIRRVVPYARTTDFPYPSSTIDIKALNTQLDKFAAMMQQLAALITRTIRLGDDDPPATLAALPLLSTLYGKFLAVDGSGNFIGADGVTGTAVSGFMAALLDDTTAAAARGTLGITGTAVDLYVDDSGATGDGTTDDSAAFAAATTALAAGQVLRLTAGKTYLLDGTWAFNKAGTIDARGATLKLKAAASSGGKLIQIQHDDVTIYGGVWDGNRAAQTAGNTGPIYSAAYARGRLIDCQVKGSEVYGVHIQDGTDWRLERLRVTDTKDAGIKFITSGADITRCHTIGCVVDNSAASDTSCAGIHYNSSGGNSTVGCLSLGNKVVLADTAQSDLIHFAGPGERNRSIGDDVEGGATAASIGISFATGQVGGVVAGATVYNVGLHGIEIANSDYCSVIGGTVDGNGFMTGDGVSVDGSSTHAYGTTVNGVTVRGVLGIGISLYKVVTRSAVTGCSVYVTDAAATGIYLNGCGACDVALNGNTLDGGGTANLGIAIIQSWNIAGVGNVIANFAAQAIEGLQNAAGTMDNISFTGGLIDNTSYIQFSSSGGGALGTDISTAGIAGWAVGTTSIGLALGDVYDWKNFRGDFRVSGGDPEGQLTAGIGSTCIRTDGAAGNQLWIKESGTGNTGWRKQGNRLSVEVAVAYSDLASAAKKTLIAGLTGARYKVRDIRLTGITGLSGGGGDRLVRIQDNSGTTIWSTITAAAAQGTTAVAWGVAGVPVDSGAAMTAQSVAGEALVAVYSGGTTDYTTGSITLIIDYERTT